MNEITITDKQARIIGREIGLGLAEYFFENMFSWTRDRKWSEFAALMGAAIGSEVAKVKSHAVADARSTTDK